MPIIKKIPAKFVELPDCYPHDCHCSHNTEIKVESNDLNAPLTCTMFLPTFRECFDSVYKYYIDDSNFIYLAPNVHIEDDDESGYTCQFSLIFLMKPDTEYFIKYNTTKKQQADLRQFYFCTLVQQFENMRKFAPNKKNVISHQKINEQFNFLFTGAIHRKPHCGGNLQKVHDSPLLNPYIKEFVKKVPSNFGHKNFLYLRNNEHMKSNIQEMVKKSVFLSWANKQY